MSNMFGAARVTKGQESLPDGEILGRYASYLDAQKAVDYLSSQDFPVEKVSIVGNDLKLVERVVGKLSYPRVALQGAMQGVWFGFFVGILLSLFNADSSSLFLYVPIAVLLGAGFWMLTGIIGYATQRGKRDFSSVKQVIASSYDVVVAREVTGQARQLLTQVSISGTFPVFGDPGMTNHLGAVNQSGAVNQPGPVNQPGAVNQPGPVPQSDASVPSGPAAQPWGTEGAGAGAPASQDTQQASPAQEQQPGSAGIGGYPDLSDGRPQYGVRIPPETPTPPPEDRSSPAEPS